ncbi:MAG: HD-GYP domain-containing protein [Nitrospiraceae bacterium]|nr:HD-GYP domain-containing protein [Nitrospiraceae bacterium]
MTATIRFKFFLVIFTLLAAIAIAFSVLSIRAVSGYLVQAEISNAESAGASVAASAAYSLASQDVLAVDNLVSKISKAHSGLDFIAVVDNNMKAVAHSRISLRGKVLPPAGKLMSLDRNAAVLSGAKGQMLVLTPVSFMNKQLGFAVVGVNRSIFGGARNIARGIVLKGLAAALILGALGVFVLTSFITAPVKELSEGVKELKEGRQKKLRIYSKDEFGQLTASFNEMSSLITEQKDKLGQYASDLEEAFASLLKVIAAAIDARDPYTMGHSERVAALSKALGKAMGLGRKQLEDLEVACLFHDVGKIKTPDHVLLKPGRLDEPEFKEMAMHTHHGAEILGKAASLERYIPAVKHHHEWFNGKGYPDGLSGGQIPLFASIISVADSFDAMTSTRPYRKPRSHAEALEELSRCSGTQFDPEIAGIFIKIYNNGLQDVLQGMI